MNHTKILVSLAVATATFAAVFLKVQSNNGGATSLLFLRGGTTANNAPPRQLQSLIATSTFQDPHTITFKDQANALLLTRHDSDELCLASINKNAVHTTSVIDSWGNFINLGLPPTNNNKGVELAIECTYTDPRTGEVFPIAANPDNPDTISVKMIDDEGVSKSSLCSRKSFQPGWYDERGMQQSWHDVCDRPPVETDSGMSILDMMVMKWNEQACPNLMNKQGGGDMWISIVGDSVTRAVFLNNLRYIEGLKVYRTWEHPDKAGPSTNSDIDFHLKAKAKETKMILAGLEVEPGRNVWFTYTFKYMCDLSASEQFEEIASADDVSGQRFCQGNWNIPQTWADFVSLRNEDPRDDDPIFSGDKIPDAVIISPGYHSSHMNAQTYGLTLGKYLDHLNPDLSVHVSLNMMPASWMIPDLYANDRRLRTQLNEYRKNLAIIETVQQRDSVRSVLDFFSSELIFNDDAHHDAVHLGGALGRRLNTINDALIIDAVCNN